MMMSGMSGAALHEWLLVACPTLAKQLIFITGGAFTPQARDYLSRIDNVWLEKPFDAANVKKVVSERLRATR